MSDGRPNRTELIALLVSQLLSDTPTALSPVVLSAEEYEALEAHCRLNRITPLLMQAVAGRLVAIEDAQAAILVEKSTRVLTTVLAIESMALRVVKTLDDAGIEVRVTKGLATAHLDYPNPALRQFGDVDLLVPPSQFGDALAVLSARDVRQKFPVRGGRWQVQHSLPLGADGLEVDLHHRLLHQAAGHLAAKIDLFANPQVFVVGGQTLKALPPHLRLLQAAGQNVLSASIDTKHSSDVDVLMLSRFGEEARRVADDAGLRWMLEMGVARARRVAGLKPSVHQEGLGARDRLLKRVYGDDRRSPLRLAIAEAMVAPPGVTLANVQGALWPGDDYLLLNGRSQRQQLWRQIGRFTGARWSADGFKKRSRR